MYVEISERSIKSRTLLYIGVVALVISIVLLCSFLKSSGVMHADIAAFIVLGFIAGLLVNKVLTSYRYSLDGKLMYFERIVGRRATLVAAIDFSGILYWGIYDKAKLPKARVTTATVLSTKKGAYAVDFTLDNSETLQRVVFHPSKELIDMLDAIERKPVTAQT